MNNKALKQSMFNEGTKKMVRIDESRIKYKERTQIQPLASGESK